jgi:hypothetical protein
MNSVTVLGIDCATQPAKTGLALGKMQDGVVRISRCRVGSKAEPPAAIVRDWLLGCDEVLLALDSPLGWPMTLGKSLIGHRAGERLAAEADSLFRRAADVDIRRRLGKLPLEVGASWLARTSVAALVMLDEIRSATGREIPLAWEPHEAQPWRVIEVYPAATRIAHGVPPGGGSIEGLAGVLDCSAVASIAAKSKDAADACVCCLAAADFLAGRAVPPTAVARARAEGWIWAPNAPTPLEGVQLLRDGRRDGRDEAESHDVATARAESEGRDSSGEGTCRACLRRVPITQPRLCPECGHVFAGRNWAGIDGHWQARHTDVMRYDDFWASLCPDHRAASPRVPTVPA